MVISNSELLIYTADSLQDWEARLTEALSSDPALAGIGIRWRRGTNVGRVWAKPKVADEVAQAAARRACRITAAGSEDEMGEVRLRGPLGATPELVPAAVMQAIATKAGVAWGQQKGKKALGKYRWRLQIGDDGRPNGKVEFRLGASAEVEAMQRVVVQEVVKINGVMLLVEVDSELLAAQRLHMPA